MINKQEDIKTWIKLNFNYTNPDAIFNLQSCITYRLHLVFKEMSGIYIITNLENKKQYIGSTKNLQYRITQHLYKLETDNHHSKYLQNAVNKYGFSKFNIRVFVINKDRDFLYDLEEQLINTLDTYKNGYNMSLNTRTPKLSEEQRKIHSEYMSNKWKGVPKTEEQKRKIGITKSIQNSGQNNPMSKLTMEQVLFIRTHVMEYTGKEFRDMFGISKSTLGGIVHLRTWKYKECIPDNYIPPHSLKSRK